MKFSQLAITALIAASAHAKVEFKDDAPLEGVAQVPPPPKQQEKSTKSKVEHPPFEPLETPKGALFFDQFLDAQDSKWKASNAVKAGTEGEFSYVGKWKIEEPTVFPGFKGDKGLVAKSPAAHHAISAIFDKPIDNTDNTLVVQYEVKLQKKLECGGAYIKLLSENAALHQEEFNNDSPYQIMFGPDKCGSTNKVHFIIRRKNPKTGEYEEKHLKNTPMARLNNLTNLYTLIIHPNQDFEIRINGEVAKAGNLLTEGVMFPPLSPPKEIDDPEDKKPEDWVDDVYIPDPEQATKPEDWDEDAPAKIPDPEAKKPEDWEEDTPLYIPDPEATKPEDWDDEEDGEFVAPEIPNPACESHGCGPWKAPEIPNPAYKGKWVQPTIPNPAYKGEWSPRKIPNPDYYEDLRPSDLEPIGGLGIEIWTMQKDILFDNFFISHSVEEAEFVGNQTYIRKLMIEQQEEAQKNKEIKPKDKKPRKYYPSALDHFRDDPVDFIVEFTRSFILNFSVDPINTIKTQPLVTLGMIAGGFILSALFFGILGALGYLFKPSAPSAADKKKKDEKKEVADSKKKEKAVTATGKSEPETEVKKRVVTATAAVVTDEDGEIIAEAEEVVVEEED